MATASNKKPAKPESEKIKDRVAREIFSLKGRRPNLAIMIFGGEHQFIDNIKNLEKEASKCGIDASLYIAEADSSQTAAEGMIEFLNNDETIDAIYIQGPAPSGVDPDDLFGFVSASKQVDPEEMLESTDWSLAEARIFERTLDLFLEKDS